MEDEEIALQGRDKLNIKNILARFFVYGKDIWIMFSENSPDG